jgi:hypothetical protein
MKKILKYAILGSLSFALADAEASKLGDLVQRIKAHTNECTAKACVDSPLEVGTRCVLGKYKQPNCFNGMMKEIMAYKNNPARVNAELASAPDKKRGWLKDFVHKSPAFQQEFINLLRQWLKVGTAEKVDLKLLQAKLAETYFSGEMNQPLEPADKKIVQDLIEDLHKASKDPKTQKAHLTEDVVDMSQELEHLFQHMDDVEDNSQAFGKLFHHDNDGRTPAKKGSSDYALSEDGADMHAMFDEKKAADDKKRADRAAKKAAGGGYMDPDMHAMNKMFKEPKQKAEADISGVSGMFDDGSEYLGQKMSSGKSVAYVGLVVQLINGGALVQVKSAKDHSAVGQDYFIRGKGLALDEWIGFNTATHRQASQMPAAARGKTEYLVNDYEVMKAQGSSGTAHAYSAADIDALRSMNAPKLSTQLQKDPTLLADLWKEAGPKALYLARVDKVDPSNGALLEIIAVGESGNPEYNKKSVVIHSDSLKGNPAGQVMKAGDIVALDKVMLKKNINLAENLNGYSNILVQGGGNFHLLTGQGLAPAAAVSLEAPAHLAATPASASTHASSYTGSTAVVVYNEHQLQALWKEAGKDAKYIGEVKEVDPKKGAIAVVADSRQGAKDLTNRTFYLHPVVARMLKEGQFVSLRNIVSAPKDMGPVLGTSDVKLEAQGNVLALPAPSDVANPVVAAEDTSSASSALVTAHHTAHAANPTWNDKVQGHKASYVAVVENFNAGKRSGVAKIIDSETGSNVGVVVNFKKDPRGHEIIPGTTRVAFENIASSKAGYGAQGSVYLLK